MDDITLMFWLYDNNNGQWWPVPGPTPPIIRVGVTGRMRLKFR